MLNSARRLVGAACRYLFNKNRLILKLRYPGLHVGSDATMDVRGSFVYESSSSIGKGANIIVPSGAGLMLGESCYIGRNVELGPGERVKIGDHTSVQDRCVVLGDVTIGNYCLFSYNVYISSGKHYFDFMPWCLIKDQDLFASEDKELAAQHSKPVVIEDDCWIGINVVVMPGVTIGKGAVIGANSVVNRDIEPYAVVAGAPAKVVKKRLDFVPQRSITYSNPHDWPYFYSGFKISKASLAKNADYNGLIVENEFVLCLDVSGGGSIHLIMKGSALHKSQLLFDGQSVNIPEQMGEVVFEVKDASKNKNHFFVKSEQTGCLLVIQRAWVK
jgi:acetyltransferase-like isoleucine patch superfamily enzyme